MHSASLYQPLNLKYLGSYVGVSRTNESLACTLTVSLVTVASTSPIE